MSFRSKKSRPESDAGVITGPKPPREQARHLAMRLDDAWLDFQTKLAIRRGKVETVIPYTGYGSTSWVRVLARVVRSDARDVAGHAKPLQESMRGWRNFTSAPVAQATVKVTIAGAVHVVHADRGGVVDARIQIALEPGWHTIRLQSGESEAIDAPLLVVADDADFGVVSDIDDTVMVTALPRPFLAAWNTFVLNEHARTPTPGMAVLYERIARTEPSAPVIYLSTGAWNVAPTLARFLSRNLYPAGPKLLTDWGPTPDRWFRSGQEHKKNSLERLAAEFPHVKWLLVGDDGQHDEAIYYEFAQRHPENVRAVAIRQLSAGEAVLAGGRSKSGGQALPGIPWIYAPDGAGMSKQLEKLGIINNEVRSDDAPEEGGLGTR
ncbi:App1 family protein [Paenarthrobacter ilicis]|uniref:Phosphatidate phosphatase APP1 n=1 Tax=Paenarthrobacter ilicis TaxID=43665 RepID=A0ABX0TFY3_9MICC|nr:phosphatase domain-containing protein [Paenarthrobacter ilicis]MBM7791936.1 phosphatidate phosphatase APP1 [Paenarthrobacter ilicis]NIJ01439.1 phosphatidate phosphatase APP1 [Paenarthrobacter ilicis]